MAKVAISVSLDSKVIKELKNAAEGENRDVSNFLDTLLKKHFGFIQEDDDCGN